MKKIFLIAILMSSILQLKADSDTTLSVLNNLVYSSTSEKELFQEYFIKDNKDYLGIFYSITDNLRTEAEVLEYIDEYIRPIEASVNKTKNRKKKIKLIFKMVHEKMFLFYSEYTLFPEIFGNGTYNCLTGTALFSVILDRFNIPYKIIELTDHVYLVAYPDEDEILMESTVPLKGYLSVNDAYKKEYVEYLRKNKLIRIGDKGLLSTNQIFEKYYYANGKIDIEQLIGLHYYNHALSLLINSKPEESINQLEKGLLFYKSPRLELLYKSALELQIEKQTYNSLESILYLSKYVSEFLSDENRDNLVAEFYKLTQYLLIDYPNAELYNKSLSILDSATTDSIFKAEINFAYNYEKGRIDMLKGDANSAYPYILEAYKMKPTNVQLESMFVVVVLNNIYKIEDIQDAKDSLNQIVSKNPNLMENKYIQQFNAYIHLRLAYNSFTKRRMNEALKELALYEEKIPEGGVDVDFQDYSGFVYSEFSSYYFRKQNRTKAKYYLKKGLEYSPGNRSLEKKLYLLNNY